MWVHCSCLQTHQKSASDIITDGCEPPCGCWDLNSGPSEEESVLLTAEPSLQPYLFLICSFVCLCRGHGDPFGCWFSLSTIQVLETKLRLSWMGMPPLSLSHHTGLGWHQTHAPLAPAPLPCSTSVCHHNWLFFLIPFCFFRLGPGPCFASVSGLCSRPTFIRKLSDEKKIWTQSFDHDWCFM